MPERRHYPKAPITEAIVDVRVQTSSQFQLERLQELFASEREQFPTCRQLNMASGVITFGTAPGAESSAASARQVGFVFVSEDKKRVLNVRTDGFSFSRLAPYRNWEEFRDECRRLWSHYRMAQPDSAFSRLGLRYVNRFDLTGDPVDLKDFFRTYPEMSEQIPEPITGFFMQLTVFQPSIKSTLVLNQTRVHSPNPKQISIVLDIDLFRESEMPSGDEPMWQFFELLHDRKNEVFEACITDRARELIS